MRFKKAWRIVIGSVALFLALLAWSNSQAAVIRTLDGATLSDNELLDAVAGLDYVILGEYHDSRPQHEKALWLLQQLHAKRPQGSLLLEMLSVGQQPLVDKAKAQMLTAAATPDLTQLARALQWQKSWDWTLYGRLVQHSFLHHYALVATNLNKDEIAILMQGAYPLQGNASIAPPVKQAIGQIIINQHGFNQPLSTSDAKTVQAMTEIQGFRDRRMAEKILHSTSPALLLTGNNHARKDMGVPLHLQDLQSIKTSGTKTGTVILMADSLADITPLIDGDTHTFSHLGDYIWVVEQTPTQH